MKKKFLALSLCLALLIVPFATIGTFAADTGYTYDEATKTYTATTADGLMAVVALVNENRFNYNIKLGADIDVTGKEWIPIGNGTGNTDDTKLFTGTFDGGNHTLKGITVTSSTNPSGLIGTAGAGCTVKNVTLTDVSIKAKPDSSPVIALTLKGGTGKVTVDNVHVRKASVTASGSNYAYVGGIIGEAGMTETEITNCTLSVTIKSQGRAGGIIGGESVGSSASGRSIKISNVIVAGTFESTYKADKSYGVGGIMGYHSTIPLTLTNCVIVGDVVGNTKGSLASVMNKLDLSVSNCIFKGPLFDGLGDAGGKIKFMKNAGSSIYDETAITATSTIWATERANATSVYPAYDPALATEDSDTNTALEDYKTATLPVINNEDALVQKVIAIFSANTFIPESMIRSLLVHTHVYDKEVAGAAYLKTAATCTEAAVYYKSCECGAFDKDTSFSYGEALGHSEAERWSDDENNHYHICPNCLEHKSDEAAHVYDDANWEITKEATEKRTGERVNKCTVCGHEKIEEIPKLVAEETTADTTAATETVEEEGGCGGTVLGMGAVMLVSVGAGALCIKKKKD